MKTRGKNNLLLLQRQAEANFASMQGYYNKDKKNLRVLGDESTQHGQYANMGGHYAKMSGKGYIGARDKHVMFTQGGMQVEDKLSNYYDSTYSVVVENTTAGDLAVKLFQPNLVAGQANFGNPVGINITLRGLYNYGALQESLKTAPMLMRLARAEVANDPLQFNENLTYKQITSGSSQEQLIIHLDQYNHSMQQNPKVLDSFGDEVIFHVNGDAGFEFNLKANETLSFIFKAISRINNVKYLKGEPVLELAGR